MRLITPELNFSASRPPSSDGRVGLPMLKNGLVVCVLCASRHHNPIPFSQPQRPTVRTKSCSKECTFAQIAWTIIPLIKQFLQLRWAQTLDRTAGLNCNCEVKVRSSDQLGRGCIGGGYDPAGCSWNSFDSYTSYNGQAKVT